MGTHAPGALAEESESSKRANSRSRHLLDMDGEREPAVEIKPKKFHPMLGLNDIPIRKLQHKMVRVTTELKREVDKLILSRIKLHVMLSSPK